MANTDWARGLYPVRQQGGACWSGAANKYYVPASDATPIYIGGLVKLAGDADADGIASVTGNVSSGDTVLGVVVGVLFADRSSPIYREASTERYVEVADDPNLLFGVQDDAGATPTSAVVGSMANLTGLTGGDAYTGYSSAEIDAASIAAPGLGTEDVLITGLEQDPNNIIGDNANWLVRLNNHQFADGVTGA